MNFIYDFCVFHAELKADRADQLVVGGSPAGRDEFPWIVSINSGRYSCAGTIISEDMILTAVMN